MKGFSYIISTAFTISWNGYYAQFKQVLIDKVPVVKEISIAINPLNPKEVICATSSGYYLSNEDTARTWYTRNAVCTKQNQYHNPQVFWRQGDACFSFISGEDINMMEATFTANQVHQGDCYYVKRTPGKIIQRSSVYADPETGIQYATWTQLDTWHSKNRGDSSFIFYSSANQRGQSWEPAKRISVYGGDCSNSDSTLMGAVCCTGLENEIYTAWAGPHGLMFRNISDKNNQAEKIIAPIKNGWQYVIGKNIRSNGLPTIACDKSKGEYRGRIYICWSDEKHGLHNKNVFVVYSDDKGENWTEPILVTYRPNHKEQFMPYMSIDQNTGYLYVLYYDQQNFFDGDLTDLYLAQSKNGGLKFDYYKVNTKPIKPHPKLFLGNYLGLSTVNNIVRPIWMQYNKKNTAKIFTALIDEKALAVYNKTYSEEIEIEKTFKYTDKIIIDFKLKNKANVYAVITKPLEPEFQKTVLKNKKMQKGDNKLVIDTKKLGLQKGNYTLTLYHHNKNTFVWITEE